jgi:hypothetical protein
MKKMGGRATFNQASQNKGFEASLWFRQGEEINV